MSEIRGGLPAGGIGLGPEEYAEFVAKEYLLRPVTSTTDMGRRLERRPCRVHGQYRR